MRRYASNVKRIGDESAFGVVMSEDLTKEHHKIAHDFSVIKVANSTKSKGAEIELIHEFFVGRHFLNGLREGCTNFSYIIGGFYCNIPFIGSKTKKALSFCSESGQKVL